MSAYSNKGTKTGLDIESIRREFPILAQQVGNQPLVYFDNAASTQKPQPVIDRICHYYQAQHANIHRGVHQLSQAATAAYEASRNTVAEFIHAAQPSEVIFTSGATESINLVASSWGEDNLGPGDEVLISTLEHHANIVPWQMLCERKGAHLKVIPIDDAGDILVEEYEKLLSAKTKIVAVAHVSNSLGTVNPVEHMIAKAHALGVPVLLDAAQSAPHLAIDVQALDCDFLVFSGHKVFGPTGIGILYGKQSLLNAMRPYQGGGDMIEKVTFEKTTYRPAPERFEAGTPHIAGAIGLAEATQYMQRIGHAALQAWEADILDYATQRIQEIAGIRIYGQAKRKVGVLSFTLNGVHPQDIGTTLDLDGIAIRTGHHCNMPLWQRYGLDGSCRASFAFYNTRAEVDKFIESLARIQKMFT